MRYLMLLYSNPAAWEEQSPEDMEAAMQFFEELRQETSASGELVDTAGLADPSLVRTIRAQAGAAVSTDGPMAEAKEVMASYAIYDVDGYDRVADIASRVAEATGGSVEIRPVMDFSGMEM